MNSATSLCRTLVDGLLMGFTFALGWFCAALLVGVALA